MSLNWKEIDQVLAETPLAGARIQRLVQPSYDSLVLGLYAEGRERDFLISIAHGACRLYALSRPAPKPEKPLRFMECLRSRLKGGRIEAAVQLGRERIVRLDLSVPRRDEEAPEDAPPEFLRYRLYARLWSGAGNIILVDADGMIVDVMARRPQRGELSGEPCRIEEELAASLPASLEGSLPAKPPKEWRLREFPPLPERPEGGSFSERIEAHYAASGGSLSRDKLLEAARERCARRERVLGVRIAELEKRLAGFREASRFREFGDILMGSQHLAYEGSFLRAEDFYRGGEVAIPVDPELGMVANAQAYYERARKADSGLAELEAELGATRRSLDEARAELARQEGIEDPFLLARSLAKGGTARAAPKKRPFPGLSLEKDGWTILVGRSAKENDELLRRHIRGADLWLHARDHAGSYVFVKARKGKSIPLEILLDAGNLALYYSKGRSGGEGDLYYTFAKYLRRAKDGPKGLVIPTQEKNLHVRLDEVRLKGLRSLIGEDT
jgi:predicted ribosome quality control (RQC) complex YloA/Tae2 family protein